MTGIPTIDEYRLPTVSELMPNVANWQVDHTRAVLLVHDMQRYFLRPFHSTNLAESLVGNVAALITYARQNGIPVAYTAQPGGMRDQQRGLLKDFWEKGMNSEPRDREIEESCLPQHDDWRLTKWRYSAFFNTELLSLLRKHGRQQLAICGVYAHIGILATAIDAFSHDLETFIVADAVAAFTREQHLATLHYASQVCACVVTRGQVFS